MRAICLILALPRTRRMQQRRRAAASKTFRIGMIAKSSTNPVFLSARTGAEAAAAELSKSMGIDIKIDWLTPPNEDGTVQAQRIAQAVNDGDNALLVSASDAGKITGAIDDAVGRGVPVMMFDSDAPQSKRFSFYGGDDMAIGAQVMSELAEQMHGKGKVAILAGNQNAPNLQKRVQGVKEEAKKYPGITILGTFNHIETPQDAAQEVLRAQGANRDIDGWAMIGGWPLFTKALLDLDPQGQDRRGRRTAARNSRTSRRDWRRCCWRSRRYLWGDVVGAHHHRSRLSQEGRAGARRDEAGAREQGQPRHVGAAVEGVGLHRRRSQVPGAAELMASAGAGSCTSRVTPRSADGRVPATAPPQLPAPSVRFRASPSASPASWRSTTSRSTSRQVRATPSAARTAPARARSARSSPAFRRPTKANCSSTGSRCSSGGPADALAAGVAMVPQELLFCENLSVAENLFLGALPSRRRLARARHELHDSARPLLESIGADIDPARRIETPEHRPAADGADRRRGWQRRPGDHLRRADQFARRDAKSSSCTP